jgi:hypothetical protein
MSNEHFFREFFGMNEPPMVDGAPCGCYQCEGTGYAPAKCPFCEFADIPQCLVCNGTQLLLVPCTTCVAYETIYGKAP